MSDSTLPEVVQSAVDRIARKEVADATSALMYELREQDKERQETEDIRAIRRNRNRFITLVAALVMGFLVPYLFVVFSLPPSLQRYTFVITIIPDALITLYAYVRRY